VQIALPISYAVHAKHKPKTLLIRPHQHLQKSVYALHKVINNLGVVECLLDELGQLSKDLVNVFMSMSTA
jgi:hypothetical protein